MKNIMKIMLALLTSVSIVSSASAGELTVTGSAKATYNMLSGGSNGALSGTGKSLGITNEIDFGATGELDNGMTWTYQVQMDPAATTGSGLNDDTRIELSSTMGTLGLYIKEGGLDVDNAASQSVYARPTDTGHSSGIVDGPGIDGFNNIQLHTPAGLLPLGAVVKVAHAPGNDSGHNSGNAEAAGLADPRFVGKSTTQVQVKLAPIDGLSLGADYYEKSDTGSVVERTIQKNEAGSVYATYKMGAASFGVSRTLVAPLILATAAVNGATANSVISNTGAAEGNTGLARQYTNNKMSAAYNVNDNVSISYEVEKSEREQIVNATENDIKAEAVQVAYTMGGMTIAVTHGTTDNVGYALNDNSTQTLFAMSLAF